MQQTWPLRKHDGQTEISVCAVIGGFRSSAFVSCFAFAVCLFAAGHQPAADHILERFEIFGSMVQSICDCGAVQSAVCWSKCLAAAPVFWEQNKMAGCSYVRSRADKCWAVKRALRSSFNVWCRVGLARALFPRFRCAWRPAKFSFLQTGNPIFFL